MTAALFAQGMGLRIAYERTGSGFPLLLLHGWPQTRRMWRKVKRALARRFIVIAADLRGYGDSDATDDPNAYDKRSMSEDMVALMDTIVPGRPFMAATPAATITGISTSSGG